MILGLTFEQKESICSYPLKIDKSPNYILKNHCESEANEEIETFQKNLDNTSTNSTSALSSPVLHTLEKI